MGDPGISAALRRIEQRQREDDGRFQAFDAHVRDCALERQRVERRLSTLEGAVARLEAAVRLLTRRMTWPLYLPLAGSIIVALAILVD